MVRRIAHPNRVITLDINRFPDSVKKTDRLLLMRMMINYRFETMLWFSDNESLIRVELVEDERNSIIEAIKATFKNYWDSSARCDKESREGRESLISISNRMAGEKSGAAG